MKAKGKFNPEYFCEHGIRCDIICFACVEAEEGQILEKLSTIIGALEYRIDQIEDRLGINDD